MFQLESSSEGADALDAQNASRLIISGNSCALARWHTKLGLQTKPFIVGLSKLSTDGGHIVLMDIVVERIFPLAFVAMSAGRSDRKAPWNEQEEAMQEDQWRVRHAPRDLLRLMCRQERYKSESCRLRDKIRKELERIEDLTNCLQSQAEESAVELDCE